jgi:hypothetical protein
MPDYLLFEDVLGAEANREICRLALSKRERFARSRTSLFLPVGWWHWVKALDVSISATFCSFRIAGRNTPLRTPPG